MIFIVSGELYLPLSLRRVEKNIAGHKKKRYRRTAGASKKT
jgi:hypothetical protein